jgi:ribosome-interacting GTPase 1
VTGPPVVCGAVNTGWSHIFLFLLGMISYHLGTLKAKLAKLRSELFVEQSGGGGGGTGEGFDVARNGDARVALIGFPSGKNINGRSNMLVGMN